MMPRCHATACITQTVGDDFKVEPSMLEAITCYKRTQVNRRRLTTGGRRETDFRCERTYISSSPLPHLYPSPSAAYLLILSDVALACLPLSVVSDGRGKKASTKDAGNQ